MDDDRVRGRDRVEIVPGRVAPLVEEALVPAAADDPLAGRCVRDPGRDPLHHVAYRAAVVELDVAEQRAGRQQVVVRVDEPRKDDAPVERLDHCARPGEREDVVVGADGEQAAAADRQAARPRGGRIHGANVAPHEDELRARSGRLPASAASAAAELVVRRLGGPALRAEQEACRYPLLGFVECSTAPLAELGRLERRGRAPQPEQASRVSGVVM